MVYIRFNIRGKTTLYRRVLFSCLCCVQQDEVKRSMDVALLLKLQKRVAELEQEKMNLQWEWDSREEQLQQEHTKVHDIL